MDDCIFCKIAAGEVAAQVVLETDHTVAFRDLNPQAPTHVLVVPKRHIPTVNDLGPADQELVGEMYLAAQAVAAKEGIAAGGYRTVMNCGEDAGQTVFHLHLHVLGGRALGWPPG